MGWLNLILEDILCEISTADAYTRYYHTIDKSSYDKYMTGRETLDRLDTLILNGVRDGEFGPRRALDIRHCVDRAEPELKSRVLNNISSKEYKTALEIPVSIEFYRESPSYTKKSWAKEGYHVIGVNGDWMATCTTNYGANNHYYGHTHWCTASDRDGEWDGYTMFQRYTTDKDSILIQFINRLDKEKCYQLQVKSKYGSNKFGDVKNFADDDANENMIRNLVGEELFDNATSPETVEKFLKTETEQAVFEDSIEDYEERMMEARKEAASNKRHSYYLKLKNQRDSFNENQQAFMDKFWAQAEETKMLGNVDLINFIYQRDTENNIPFNSDTCKKSYYIGIDSFYKIDDTGLIFLSLGQLEGPKKEIDYDYDCDEDEWGEDGKPYIYDENNENVVKTYNSKGYYVLAHLNEEGTIDKILNCTEPFHEKQLGIYTIGDPYGAYHPDYGAFWVYNYDGENSGIYFPLQNKFQEIPIPDGEAISTKINTMDGKEIFFSSDFVDENDDGPKEAHFMCDAKTKDTIEVGCGQWRYDFRENIALYKSKGGNKFIIIPSGNTSQYRMVEIPKEYTYSNPHKLGWRNIVATTIKEFPIVKSFSSSVGNNAIKIYDDNTTKFIFGKNGVSVIYSGVEPEKVFAFRNDKTLFYYDDNTDSYNLVKSRPNEKAEIVPCDENGETEQDKNAKRNFEKWQQQGGHSPETKAQMDQMWNDFANSKEGKHRKGGYDRQKELGDWSLEDNPQDFNSDSWSYDEEQNNFKSDPMWRGALGMKDPTLRYMTSDPNEFYRIGIDGKPLDQPWNDDDEIPARLSDRQQRVYRESKRRIKTLNESANKMFGLFDKLFD